MTIVKIEEEIERRLHYLENIRFTTQSTQKRRRISNEMDVLRDMLRVLKESPYKF